MQNRPPLPLSEGIIEFFESQGLDGTAGSLTRTIFPCAVTLSVEPSQGGGSESKDTGSPGQARGGDPGSFDCATSLRLGAPLKMTEMGSGGPIAAPLVDELNPRKQYVADNQ